LFINQLVDQLSQDNINAIEAPLAGSEPPLADVRSDYSHSNVSKERPDNMQVPEQSCEFIDPEDTSLRKWSPSEPFRAFLEKNLNKFITNEHFQMDNLMCLKHLLNPNDYIVKLDLKDAYLF
jgi:hypothetical protein